MVEQFGSGYMMSQGTGTAFEVRRKSHFEVTIEGVESILTAQTVKVPTTNLEQVKVYHYNDNIRYAAKPDPEDLVVEFLDHINPTVVDALWTWYKRIYDSNNSQMGYASDYKRTGKVFEYDVKGNLIHLWTCYGVWPKNAPTAGEPHSYEDQNPVRITMNFSVDRVTKDGLGSGNTATGGAELGTA